MADQGGEGIQGIHVTTDIRTIRPMTTKFGKQKHLEELTQMRLIKQVLVTSAPQDCVTN